MLTVLLHYEVSSQPTVVLMILQLWQGKKKFRAFCALTEVTYPVILLPQLLNNMHFYLSIFRSISVLRNCLETKCSVLWLRAVRQYLLHTEAWELERLYRRYCWTHRTVVPVRLLIEGTRSIPEVGASITQTLPLHHYIKIIGSYLLVPNSWRSWVVDK